jgi:hypothetical protein
MVDGKTGIGMPGIDFENFAANASVP